MLPANCRNRLPEETTVSPPCKPLVMAISPFCWPAIWVWNFCDFEPNGGMTDHARRWSVLPPTVACRGGAGRAVWAKAIEDKRDKNLEFGKWGEQGAARCPIQTAPARATTVREWSPRNTRPCL